MLYKNFKILQVFTFFLILTDNNIFMYTAELSSFNNSNGRGSTDSIVFLILLAFVIVVAINDHVKKNPCLPPCLPKDVSKSLCDNKIDNKDSIIDFPGFPEKNENFFNLCDKHSDSFNTLLFNILLSLLIVYSLLVIYIKMYESNIFRYKNFVDRLKFKYPRFNKIFILLIILIFWLLVSYFSYLNPV